MAKKVKKKKELWTKNNFVWDVLYTNKEKVEANEKQAWASVRKREKQLDTIAILLKKMLDELGRQNAV